VRYEDFADDGQRLWLDVDEAPEAIRARLERGELSAEQAAGCERFHRDGVLVLENAFDHDLADRIRADIEARIVETEGMPIGERKMKFENLFFRSEATREGMLYPPLLEWLDLLLGMRAMPYQSLTWPVSSQIGPHADSILMTTHPRDGLIATWTALEDITPTCGPVFGIPGSHRWPYLSAAGVGIPPDASEAECARIYDERYYARVRERVEAADAEPYTFVARKGDVLIWHSNLIHGAKPIERADETRMCLIVHYFGEATMPYSDLFHRPCEVPRVRE
jgi:ectoine hydroxylase-related dioxygenase (phytanoyl-CoA dioxygenase family)